MTSTTTTHQADPDAVAAAWSRVDDHLSRTPVEGMHPEWCDFESGCTDEIVNTTAIQHRGRRTTWYPSQDADRQVGIELVHGEDRVTGDPVDYGTRWIDLSITLGGDGGGVGVMLAVDDARLLSRQLEAYAKRLEREPDWLTREHLGMSSVEYAVDQGILIQNEDGTVSLAPEPESGSDGVLAPDVVSMSVRQAAAVTSLTEGAIRDAIFDDDGLQAHVVGKRVVILPEDLRAWVAGHHGVQVTR